MHAPLVDIHTHQNYPPSPEIISLRSLRPLEQFTSNQLHTCGLHPWYAADLTEQAFAHLSSRLQHEAFWGIGEAGLDKLSPVALNTQILFFQKQVELSEALTLPLVIHCVRAWGELLQCRKGCRMPWIIHGFRSKVALAKQLLASGCYLSLGQYYQSEVLVLAHEAGRLFLETDDKALNIALMYEQAAQQLALPMEQLQRELYDRFLDLSAFCKLS